MRKYTVLILLGIILAAGLFLRLYDLPDMLHFAGDEGRDMFIANDIASGEEFPSLGPSASTGGFFLGPVFYYFMAVPVMFSAHPAAPAILIAIFSTLTILLLYITGRRMGTSATGLIAAALFATSFLAVLYGRWSWNPNLLPFFIVLIILCLFEVSQRQSAKTKWWREGGGYAILLGFSLGIVLQLHATAFLLLPALLIFWLIFPPRVRNYKTWLVSAGIFVLTILPWLRYEFTHGFSNSKGAFEVLNSAGGVSFINRFGYVLDQIVAFTNEGLLGGLVPLWLTAIVIIVIAGLFIWRLVARLKMPRVAWLFVITTGLAVTFYLVYSGLLFPHYFILLLPFIFLAFGLAATGKWWRLAWVRLLIIALVLAMSYAGVYSSFALWQSVKGSTAVGSYGVSLADEEGVVTEIKQVSGDSIDLAIITKDNFYEAFAYLLSQEQISVSPDSPIRAIIYRPSENMSTEKARQDLHEVKEVEIGNLGLIIGAK